MTRSSDVCAVGMALVLSACLFGGGPPPPPSPVQRLNAEGALRLGRGDLVAAEASFEAALERAERLDDLAGQAEAWNNLGTLSRVRGDLEGALARHRRARFLHEQARRPAGIHRSLQHEAAVLLGLGRAAEARAVCDRALEQATQHGDDLSAARSRIGLAAIALTSRAPDAALDHATRALETADAHGDEELQAAAQANRGAALRALGRRAEATSAFEAALRVDRRREAAPAVAADLEALAGLAERDQDAARAARLSLREGTVRAGLEDHRGARTAFARALRVAQAGALELEAREAERRLQSLPESAPAPRPPQEEGR